MTLPLGLLVTTLVLLVTPTAGASEEPRELAVSLPTGADPTAVRQFADMVGRTPERVMFYLAWGGKPAFPAAAAAQLRDLGAVPEITWEPWDPAGGVAQPRYALATIASGKHDAYVASWAKAIRAYGGPVVLRFAHEMNGDWYPWAASTNRNSAATYVAAWRRVVDVFRRHGAGNVRWTWAPNVPYPGSTPLAALYPGDAYVDRVALDGYNWGSSQTWSTWQGFGDVFGPGVAELDALSSRPIHVAEVASTEVGGDKAAWVRDMFAWLEAHPEVRGITWFNHAKEADWRVESSEASLEAFREGLATFD